MAMFSNGGITSPDIWMVISFILIALISIVLNPLVFRHNFYKKSSIARALYMTLSATDFVASIYQSTLLSMGILSPKEEQCVEDHNATFCQKNYYEYSRAATTTEKALGSIAWSLGSIPIVITAVLSLTRWYQITFPLKLLTKRTVGTSLIAFITAVVAYMFCTMFNDASGTVMTMTMQTTKMSAKGDKIYYYVPVVAILIFTWASNIASISTVWTIVKSPVIQGNVEIHARKTRSAIRIVLLNAGNVVWSGLLFSIPLTNSESKAHPTNGVNHSAFVTLIL
ncbi:hypothetical protein ACHWQZ_G018075 [Mnemiopsis leidyi]